MTVAGAWCVTTEEAQMAIGVPVTRGAGVLAFNACRIYSAKTYPYLVRMSRHAVNRDKPRTMELDNLFLKIQNSQFLIANLKSPT